MSPSFSRFRWGTLLGGRGGEIYRGAWSKEKKVGRRREGKGDGPYSVAASLSSARKKGADKSADPIFRVWLEKGDINLIIRSSLPPRYFVNVSFRRESRKNQSDFEEKEEEKKEKEEGRKVVSLANPCPLFHSQRLAINPATIKNTSRRGPSIFYASRWVCWLPSLEKH